MDSELFMQALNESVIARQHALSLFEILRQLAEHACEITGAQYGAVAVAGRKGAFKEFAYAGMPEPVVHRIEASPTGSGLLGAVVREGRTIRVARVAADSRSVGLPSGHPPLSSFLGVPLRLGKDVCGGFYVADKKAGEEFTDRDAEALERLSRLAAVTVAFARQGEEEQRRLFEALLYNAPHGIAFFPADANEDVYGNPAAERMLGRIARGNDPTRQHHLTFPDGRPVPPDELPSSRALHGEPVINLEAVVVRPDERIPVLVSAAPVLTDARAVLGAVVIVQDITSLKELERLRDEFTAIVAHDLRTPVQALLLQLEQLLRRATGEASLVPVKVLQSMKLSSERLKRLVADLLDASRIESHRLVMRCKAVNLADRVRSLLAQIGITLRDHRVVFEVGSDAPPVMADPQRVDQIVTNLIENAAKYAAPSTPIRIVVEAADGGALLSVEDRGPGIAPEDMPRLFDRFYQTRRGREMHVGLGLGLYIARALATAQGGTLSAESTPGLGSAFRLWLPGAPQRHPSPSRR